MAIYTLAETPQFTLYSDGVAAIVAADNYGASVLVDLFNYLQDPETGNSEGVILRYLHSQKSWIAPDGSVVLFNVATPEIFSDLNREIKKYSKSPKVVRTISSPWGFLSYR